MVRTNGIKNNPDAARRLSAVEGLAKEFLPTAVKNRALSDPCHARSWRILEIHTEYVTRFAAFLIRYAEGDIDSANASLNDMIDYLSHVEDEIHPQFDLVLFRQRFVALLKQ